MLLRNIIKKLKKLNKQEKKLLWLAFGSLLIVNVTEIIINKSLTYVFLTVIFYGLLYVGYRVLKHKWILLEKEERRKTLIEKVRG